VLTHDPEMALAFLQRLYPAGPWALSAINVEQDGLIGKTFYPETENDLRVWLADNKHRNIYYSVNRMLRAEAKADKTEILDACFVHVDVDPRVGEDLTVEIDRIRKLLENPPSPIPRPTIAISSGGGINALWRLDLPFEINGALERALEFERYNLKLEIALGGDHCHNVDRILRLPGSINRPNSKKRKKGRVESRAEVLWFDDTVYPLSAFVQATPIQLPGSGIGGASGKRQIATGNVRRLSSVDELPESVSARTRMLIVQGTDPDDPTKWSSRSETLFHVCCELVRSKVPAEMIYAIITDPDFRISASVLDKGSSIDRYALRQIDRAEEYAIDPWLMRLNERHAVIANIGGTCRVIEEIEDPVLKRSQLTMQTFTDFRNRYMHQRVQIGTDDQNNPITSQVGKWWLEHSSRKQFDCIVFSPGALDVGNAYNLWRGFKYEPRPGDKHLPLLDHIRTNICSNDDSIYNYVIGWLARAVQHPNTPGEVAIVLRGKMGTGKSLFAKSVGELFGRHFLHVSNAQHLVGNFNAQLRDAVLVFADEAFYAGDKKHESVLKTLITEETIVIERKGVDAEQMPNYTHLIMASNSDWVAPAGPEERRYLVLDVNDKNMQDTDYFGRVRESITADGGAGFSHLLHFLMHQQLATFDVRRVPRTAALRDQKILSMSSEMEWWFSKLEDGVIAPGHLGWSEPILKSVFLDNYLTYSQRVGNRRSTATSLGKFIRKAVPEGLRRFIGMRHWEENGVHFHERAAWYQFPPLEACRKMFDRAFGGPYEWPVLEERSLHEDSIATTQRADQVL
jgi:hypothetical protein